MKPLIGKKALSFLLLMSFFSVPIYGQYNCDEDCQVERESEDDQPPVYENSTVKEDLTDIDNVPSWPNKNEDSFYDSFKK